MFNRTTWIILALAVLAAVLGGWLQQRSRTARQPAGVAAVRTGAMAPAMTFSDLQGRPYRLSGHRGARVLVNFWATWCVPCLAEMPALDRASARGLPVIGVAMDEPANVRTFLVSHPVRYPIVLGELSTPSSAQRLGDADDVLPYSVLIGADGRILAARRGVLDRATLLRWRSEKAPR